MPLKKKKENTRPRVDLSGPEGNAFFIISYSKKWCKDLNLDFSNIFGHWRKMHYDEIVALFCHYFSDYADIETDNEELIGRVNSIDIDAIHARLVTEKLSSDD